MTSTLVHLLKPFAPFLANPNVTDVVVNRPGEIGVEESCRWSWHAADLSFERLDAIGILAAYQANQDISPTHPVCGATLPDGERIHICRPPATRDTISLTIRRPPAFKPTMDHLSRGGMFSHQAASPPDILIDMANGERAQRLAKAVIDRKNILIAGPTGSGKTTMARALIELIPLDERLITIEDTAEWNNLPHRNRVALFYAKGDQGAAKIRSEELIESSLRMRPDRVLMQELRDGAAFAYLRGVVGGHPGCITTLHAGSAMGAFDALRLMTRQHPDGKTMADGDIKDMLRMMIDVVIHLKRDAKANRYWVDDMYEKGAV